eukprot:TRINITY_DN19213_c0_g1_i4.p1 TRINITY_DN19213_c0_g1~~TRINITY_DN19213_c0_g1_i4.p1  ORF type:complete len:241 (+),score=48.33 TRINITY_DN19213_c0_g1_i4:191-913(+)
MAWTLWAMMVTGLVMAGAWENPNRWGSLDGAGAYTVRRGDQLDEQAGGFQSLQFRDRRTDQRSKAGVVPGLSRTGGNFAQAMVSSSSSVAEGALGPAAAVDGNLDQSWGSCTHTSQSTDPWWEVDLGESLVVTGVRLFVPGEGTGGLLHTPQARRAWGMSRVEVLVGNDGDEMVRCNRRENTFMFGDGGSVHVQCRGSGHGPEGCLLYTSDAADEEDSVDLGGRRIIKKKKKTKRTKDRI